MGGFYTRFSVMTPELRFSYKSQAALLIIPGIARFFMRCPAPVPLGHTNGEHALRERLPAYP